MRENGVVHISFGGGLDDIARHNPARINASNCVGKSYETLIGRERFGPDQGFWIKDLVGSYYTAGTRICKTCSFLQSAQLCVIRRMRRIDSKENVCSLIMITSDVHYKL